MWYQRISKAIKKAASPQSFTRFFATEGASPQPQSISPRAFFQLNRLQLNASRFLPGRAAGLRPSLRRKPASEFREHRLYVPGDDIRFVDWKASARQEHIFIKLGEQPKEATVYILIDCSASMGWGTPPKSNTACLVAMALSFLALTHGDRLVIVPLNSDPPAANLPARQLHPLGPLSGKGQYPHLVTTLNSLVFCGQVDLVSAVRNFRYHQASGGGLTILISDLLGVQDIQPVLEFLPAPTWDVILLHMLHPQELQPNLQGDFEMQDIETQHTINYDINPKNLALYQQQLQSWRANLEMGVVQSNAFYSLIPTNWSLEHEIIPHFRAVNILKPL